MPGALACTVCGAPLPAGSMPAEEGAQEERLQGDGAALAAPGRRLFSYLAKRAPPGDRSERLRSFLLRSGSPVFFAAILLAAIVKDNVKWPAMFPPSQGEAGDVASGDVRMEDARISEEAAQFDLPLNITTLPSGEEKTAAFEIVSDGFERPRGVTVANGRLYVVDPDQGALFVLDAGGEESAHVLESNRPFVEPVDVAADAAGNIYVLDAGGGGQVSIHDADGGFVQVVPTYENVVDRSRGIDVDGRGRIWLALTPALAVAAYDTDGQELIRIATDLEGRDVQPVDVAFYADDAVFVSTTGMTAVIRFSISGEPLQLWPLVTANSVDGPHLSLDSNGVLYVTQPESGGFLRIFGDSGEEAEAWALPASQPLRRLVGISVAGEGNLVVADSENGNIYRIPIAQ